LFTSTDQIGSVRAVTDGSSAVLWEGEHGASGNLIEEKMSAAGVTANYEADYVFGGKFRDDDVDLVYFNARFYDADTGRFISVDPALDGDNWYVYCSNNELVNTDPTGLYDKAVEEQYGKWRDYVYNVVSALAPIEKLYSDSFRRELDHVDYMQKLEKFNSGVDRNAFGENYNVIKSTLDFNRTSADMAPEVLDYIMARHASGSPPTDEEINNFVTEKQSARNIEGFVIGSAITISQYYSMQPIEIVETTVKNANENPVVFKIPSGATPEEIAQMKEYARLSNQALDAGKLSPTGRVSTAGALRADASAAAAAERARAAAEGVPYNGHAGHVPDTTWTGGPEPYTWLDLTPKVNSSLGGQAKGYPLGYKPTRFSVE
jgi:RHS repeat-associated protein